MGRKELEKVVFNREIENVTKKRAEAVSMDYAALLTQCGATSAVWESARKAYTDACARYSWDKSANLGMMRADLYEKICLGFMLVPESYKVDTPPTLQEQIKPPSSADDIALTLESISNHQLLTQQILREIRSAIDDNTVATSRLNDVVSRCDKLVGACNEIKSNTSHLIDIKKDVNTNRKTTASIDQRLNGLNQIIASQKIAIEKIRSMIERFVSGK